MGTVGVAPGASSLTADEIRDRARAMVEQHGLQLEQLRGKRIRVVRAIVYEGDAWLVLEQLARSLPVGTRAQPIVGGGRSGPTINVTVIQDQPEILVDDVDLCP